MANQNIHYDLNLLAESADLKEFVRVIGELRTVKRLRVRGDLMLLEDIDLVNIDLEYQLRTIRLKIRVDKFDFIGYVDREGILWELCSDGDFQYLPGSHPSGVSVNYATVASDKNINIGCMAMNNAFNMLWSNDPNGNRDEIQAAVQTISLMVCETAKFHWSYVEVFENLERNLLLRVPEWMMILANRWETITSVARLSLPRDIKIPEDLDSSDWDRYNTRDFSVFDTETTTAAPYFARLVICVGHIATR